MRKTIFTLAACAAFAALPYALAEEGKTKTGSGKLDGKSLTGEYKITRGERDGKPLPKGDFDRSVVTFTADKIFGKDKNTKEFFSCSYVIDQSSTPAVITMMSTAPKKEKTSGVIETDGSTVRICYALPGGEIPKTFKAGVKQHCFTLQRVDKGR